MDKHNILKIIAVVIGVLLVFQVGVFIGYRKALFSYRGGERVIGMMEGGRNMMYVNGYSPSHGAIGKIVSVSLPTFIVAGPDNNEKTVLISDDTTIRRYRDNASTSAIAPNQFVLVLGDPDDSGTIEARFIRIMPPTALTSPAAPKAPIPQQ